MPAGSIVRSAFDPLVQTSLVCSFPASSVPSTVAPPLKVVAPVTPSVVDIVAAPVTAKVDPLNERLPSAVIALVPFPVNTASAVNELAPVPPSATGTSVPPAL